MLKWYYCIESQGYRFICDNDEPLFIRDWQAHIFKAHLDFILLYSDGKSLTMDQLWGSQPRISHYPWDKAFTLEKTDARVAFLQDNPAALPIWFETADARAIEKYRQLKKRVFDMQDTELLTCLDGPCEGDPVYVPRCHDRVVAFNNTIGNVYERKGDGLAFVRTWKDV